MTPIFHLDISFSVTGDDGANVGAGIASVLNWPPESRDKLMLTT